ncbi:MAG: hypothetical protein Q8O55_11410 [Dehalococcoidales bacterium]|nr:hypothetical protein [Dehalococcoidales bacterium]
MGQYFIDQETVRVDFPDGQWIELKEELSQADSDYIMSRMAHAESDGKTTKTEIQLGHLALMERMIKGWSFENGTGPVPVNRENISVLKTRYRAIALEKINELVEKAGEFSKN